MDLVIRPLAEADLPGVLALEEVSHPTPWSEGMFRSEMTQEISCFLVVHECTSGRLVGYGGFWNMVGDGNITNVTVAPEFRRRGIGRRIVEELLERMRQQTMEYASLEVRDSNASAIHLYESCGFSLLGRRPGYYGDGETARIYGRRLADG
ncbi:MAG TPA: ribosomal protein S18-alanine N-acetyltransferase [Spirochaetota bacterium]|nr:ribosomal protein S18-alanine N-acetyltransferase [Spirochaetota bacterium]